MRRNLSALVSSKTSTWGTPWPLFDLLDRQFGFTIDLAALPSNAKHARFFSPQDNALTKSWAAETGYLNCPYGRGIGQWIEKARDSAMEERALVVMLLPARVDAEWFRRYVMSTDGAAGKLLRSEFDPEGGVLWLRWQGLVTGVHFYPERICFEGMGADGDEGDSAPFPSAIVVHAHPSRRPPAPKLEPGEVCLTRRWPR